MMAKKSAPKAPEMEVLSDASSDEGSVKEEETLDAIIDPTIAALNSLTDLLENPQDFLHTLLLPPTNANGEGEDDNDSDNTHLEQVATLRETSKVLFSRLEKLAHMMERVENKRKGAQDEDDGEDEDSPLSGLSELYTGEKKDDDDDDDDEPMVVDAETIWGQVDIQNVALLARVTKSIRKLSKRTENTQADGDYHLRLLNMEDINSGDDNDEDEDASDAEMDASDGEEAEDDEDDDDDEEEGDEDAKRIRERMERAMEEMDDSDGIEEDDGNDDDESEQSPEDEKEDDDEEDEVDQAREELNDGFFDLHEMEAFADDEEEMLPDDAYGEPEPENEKTMQDRRNDLPHLRGRRGKDDDEDDEEFNELEKRVEPSARRKKYREDEEINVLESLYDEVDDDDDDDDSDEDEEDNAVNMSAAAYFGKPRQPSKEYTGKLKKKSQKKATANDGDDSDADSWDNHDFEGDGADWRKKSDNAEDEDGDDNDNDNDGESDNEEEENEVKKSANEDKKLSDFAQRTKKMTALTEVLEKEALAEKPWQMLGEASSKKRPENSLLEVTPEFEFASKMAPIITQEHTVSIEEMIKLRILAEDWDDVVPRELPDIGLDKRNGELPEVSQEKSKLSLGELYEREYLKKAVGYDKDAVEKETEEEKARSEMKMLFANICSKLDALSNYHFAPRPVADEADVKTAATPAIAMEEVLPLHVSDARALAPEEIFGKKKGREGILRGESEMDQVSLYILSKLLSIHSTTLRSLTFMYPIRLLRTGGSQSPPWIQKGSPPQIQTGQTCRREAHFQAQARAGTQ